MTWWRHTWQIVRRYWGHPLARLWLMTWILPVLACLSAPAAARLDYSDEEKELLEWARASDSGLRHAVRMERFFLAEDRVHRSLLLARCPHRNIWGRTDRYLSQAYIGAVEEAALIL